MIRFPALAALRIGCVQYLNSKPLIAAWPGEVVFDHPSRLARALAAGALDAALVPIFEALGPRQYFAVDGVAIACDGPVYSVFLAHEGELSEIRTLEIDPASLTSVHLVQVLLREFHGVTPRCVPAGETADARLIIGNQAIEYRRAAPAGLRFLDLGEEWKKQTGLPFVFALWLLRPALPDLRAIAEDFRALKEAGRPLIPAIAQKAGEEIGGALALRYLTDYIRFDLGERERAGIERFHELLVKHGFLEASGTRLRFV
ncbi:MAG TPA: menaquinone biosynthesis protein [Chthoniobacteraceae bacterium]|nr:menaquinone biosynthesis protein [Chthoniobacteraceae bacterium]